MVTMVTFVVIILLILYLFKALFLVIIVFLNHYQHYSITFYSRFLSPAIQATCSPYSFNQDLVESEVSGPETYLYMSHYSCEFLPELFVLS